jgi:quercetin dioxygenase-like cupin family protein
MDGASSAGLVEKWDEKEWGPLSESNMRKKLKAQGYPHVYTYTYSPGTHFPNHTHSMEKKDAVLSGTFQLQLGDKTVVLKAGDMVRVPAGAVHNATVLGQEPVVSLDASK